MKSLKAIAFGSLIDVVGTLLVGGFIGFVLAIYLISSGVSEYEMEKIITVKIMKPPWSVLGYTVGCFISIFAGYMTAKISKTNIYVCASAVGAISGIFGFYLGLGHYSPIFNAFLSFLAICSIFLGAYLWSRGNAPNKSLNQTGANNAPPG